VQQAGKVCKVCEVCVRACSTGVQASLEMQAARTSKVGGLRRRRDSSEARARVNLHRGGFVVCASFEQGVFKQN
jgi:ferredoxin